MIRQRERVGRKKVMKIENTDLKIFLKENGKTILSDGKLSKNKPSIKRKHVKKGHSVAKALEELNKSHNWSWYEEIFDRYKNVLEKEAIFYRGNSISANQMFAQADILANSFDKIGIKKGEEILACMSNVPETIYLLLAASKCGAVINFLGADFNENYIRQIVSSQKRKVFIGTDDSYSKISKIISGADIEYKRNL